MFAVVQVAGNQYHVAEGDVIKVQRLDYQAGKTISLDDVVLFVNGDDVQIGKPFLKNVKVAAKVIGEQREPKVIAFKYRKRKDSARVRGHRQTVTALSITKISV